MTKNECVRSMRGLLKMIRRPVRFYKYLRLRISRLPGAPHRVALGLAVGIFAGILPLTPFRLAAIWPLAAMVNGSKAAALVGTIPFNVCTIVPHYLLLLSVGYLFFPLDGLELAQVEIDIAAFWTLKWELLRIFLTGGLVLATPISIASYFLVRHKLNKLVSGPSS